MVCDSTNATVAGRSASEGKLFEPLRRIIANATGRVVVACFASNIARLTTLARVASATERHFGLLGRSETMFAAAKTAGVWDGSGINGLVDPAHLGYLPRRHMLAVATGSQGAPRGALARLAANDHPYLALEAGDSVIFSARFIPGNEPAVASLIERLQGLGVQVITHHAATPIHASGHPAATELADMYRWVRPRLAIPVHGEPAHLRANARIAKAAGVANQLVGGNGDLFMIAPVAGVRRRAVPVGRIAIRDGAAPAPTAPAAAGAGAG